MLCIIDNFNKAWHERVEVESTDNESILNKKSNSYRKKRNKLSSSSDSDNEGINTITYAICFYFYYIIIDPLTYKLFGFVLFSL